MFTVAKKTSLHWVRWQIVRGPACKQASIQRCQHLISLAQLDWCLQSTRGARGAGGWATTGQMKCPSRWAACGWKEKGGGSTRQRWRKGGLSRAFVCLHLFVLPVKVRPEGRAVDAANQCRRRCWERHKHSQLSQPLLWGITRSEGAREDYLHCGHRLVFVLFWFFFSTNAQHSSSWSWMQHFLTVVCALCKASTFSLVKQHRIFCFICRFYSPDATTVLAHSVFSMLRLSWIWGSESSCRRRSGRRMRR